MSPSWIAIPRFKGLDRQQSYLKRLDALSPPARYAFGAIYTEAVSTQGGGGHIVRAAIAAMNLPEIFGFARENLVMRLQLSRARAKQDAAKVRRLEERLEDFHIAADAFMLKVPLEAAATARQQGHKADGVCAKMPTNYVHPMHNDRPAFRLFRRFVELMRPYLRAKGATADPGLSVLNTAAEQAPTTTPH